MANDKNKKEQITEERMSTDSTIRELQATVDSLPRTDHMTLPAIQMTEIDPETRARMEAMVAINNATKPDEVIDETGRTLEQVRNQFEFGVTNLDDEGAKHQIIIGEEDGKETVTIISPAIEVPEGADEIPQSEVVLKATPANIAPIDADAPHNPVEARAAQGKNEDGSEGDATSTVAPPAPVSGGSSAVPVGNPNNVPVKDSGLTGGGGSGGTGSAPSGGIVGGQNTGGTGGTPSNT